MDILEQAKKLFFEGLEFFDAEDYENAVEKFLKANELMPVRLSVLNNLVAALMKLRRYLVAMEYAEAALACDPQDALAHCNMAFLKSQSGQDKEALVAIENSLKLDPENENSWECMAVIQRILDDYASALDACQKAVSLGLPKSNLIGDIIHAKLALARWTGLESDFEYIKNEIPSGLDKLGPYHGLCIPMSGEEHLQVVRNYVGAQNPVSSGTQRPPNSTPKERIHVGYFSSDFRIHPVFHLMAGIFEHLDKDRFKLTAFSIVEHERDPMRERLEDAFDHFIDISNMEIDQVHQLIGNSGIDIAVDLNGYTGTDLTPIFNAHIPPVQVSMVGYCGTMGLDCYDYILGDWVSTPIMNASQFSEKLALMPGSYLPQDNSLAIYEGGINRQSQNLPQNAFVFCGFNHPYKITPDLFSIWMKLLEQVEDSVLWLRGQSNEVVANLRREADDRGIDPDRLVFAHVEPLDVHIARHRLADLFLDSFYYNAHTTACDALYAGLPVLTCCGNSFVSRVGSSLVTAAGIPEMIAESHGDYYSMALDLAKNPVKLDNIRQKLRDNHDSCTLFDTEGYARELEKLYTKMMKRHWAGEMPDHIVT